MNDVDIKVAVAINSLIEQIFQRTENVFWCGRLGKFLPTAVVHN